MLEMYETSAGRPRRAFSLVESQIITSLSRDKATWGVGIRVQPRESKTTTKVDLFCEDRSGGGRDHMRFGSLGFVVGADGIDFGLGDCVK